MVSRPLRDKGVREFVEAARRLRAQNATARFQLLGPRDPSPLAIGDDELARWRDEGAIEYLGENVGA